MKKVIVSMLMLVLTTGAFAQTNKDHITVNGVHKFDLAPEYTAKMIVSLTNVYYDTEQTSLSEIKSGYLDKLSKIGIKSDHLKENDIYYALLGYDKDGTVLEFKTKSLDDIKNLLGVRSIGVTKSDATMEGELTDSQMADYGKAAFDNAKKKAEAMASKIGRKIGKAITINDSNTNKISESLYYGTQTSTREYYISVSFELL